MARTRSASAHRKVLDAALKLIAERGVDATSVDAIARESGVSKATIYKHWAGKDALLLDLVAEVHTSPTHAIFDSGNTKADLIATLSYKPTEGTDLRRRITPHFVAYCARNASFAAAWRKLVMEPPRRQLKRLMRLGIKRGELSPKLDLDMALSLLLGPIMYWHIFLKRASESSEGMVAAVVDSFWRAFGVKKFPSKS